MSQKPLLTKYRANIWAGREHWKCERCSMVYSRPKPDLDDLRIEGPSEHIAIWRPPLCGYCGDECLEFTLQEAKCNYLIVSKLDAQLSEEN